MTMGARTNCEIKSSAQQRLISSSVVRTGTASILLALATPVFSDTDVSLTSSVTQTDIFGLRACRSLWPIQRAPRLFMASGPWNGTTSPAMWVR